MKKEKSNLFYDPPEGWMYGFPKPYTPLEGESIKDTLIRDGYPEDKAELGVKWCRFIGYIEDIRRRIESETLE